MIVVHKNTKIYAMCPAATFTGGPELLHQLVNKMTLAGYEAYMVYSGDAENPVHPNFVIYNNKYTTEIEDNPENILIVPEIYITKVGHLTQIRKCVWWLSIDNFFKPYFTYPAFWMFKMLKQIGLEGMCKELIFKLKVSDKFQYHIVQSYYAKMFLKQHKIESEPLYDYLSAAFLQNSTGIDLSAKKPQVLYNPKKGFEFTAKLIEQGKDINWIPLEGMKPAEVVALLKESMVYIDFGTHPGRDRFPREAAILQCCVITGKRGSANYYEDVPITDQYKIEDKVSNIPHIINTIRACMSDFHTHIQAFESYRQMILSAEKMYMESFNRIFEQTPSE
ncbi:hypothetical protein GCM10022209_51420 [Chitinophaga oryziterrae]